MDESRTEATLERAAAAGVLGVVLLLVAIGAAGWLTIRGLLETRQWVAHTNEVIRRLDQTRAELVRAESGNRGLLLSGRAEFLQDFQPAVDGARDGIARLRELVRDSPRQRATLEELAGIVESKISVMETMLGEIRSGSPVRAREIFTGDEPRIVMVKAQRLFDRIRSEETERLTRRLEDEATSARRAVVALGAGIGAGCLALIGALWVTRRQLAHRRRSEAERDRFFQLSYDLMCVSDAGGRLLRVNGSWERVLGYPCDELVGREFLTMIHPEDIAATREAMVSLAGGIPVVGFENRYRTADGETRWMQWSAASVPAEGMNYAVARDVTERRRLDAELEQRSQELARSNRELQQFAYVASHDLQEPLRMVASYVELLARRYKGKLDADADEFIAFAADGARRMQALIRDLLAFSRVEARGKPLVSIDANLACDMAIANLQAAIEAADARVTRDELPEVLADETQLTQLFQNLIGNAIKFRRDDQPPSIHVGVEQADGGWQFTVRDNGIGIDPTYGERIFLMFQRLHGRDRYDGTGIGLAICQRIVERHGGRIWVESAPGEGSAFSFTLAAAGERENATECAA